MFVMVAAVIAVGMYSNDKTTTAYQTGEQKHRPSYLPRNREDCLVTIGGGRRADAHVEVGLAMAQLRESTAWETTCAATA
mmetsp:Transcript_69064/g.192254  ORF Transcript_69064/g.192254 Transcript_69064/m.192254 type:complete len:80 (+) Transcript_69064:38-277(+)